MSKALFLGASALVGGSLAISATAAPGPGALQRLAKHSLAVSKGADHRRVNLARGKVKTTETATVVLPGFGSRAVIGVIEDVPVADGGHQKATITDRGQTTTFEYVPASNTLTISGAGGDVAVAQNPDHSYSVNGRRAGNGAAAVALLRKTPTWKAASPHSVVLAYSYAQHPNMAAKGSNEAQNPAVPPAVCSIFEDFCEAALCDKSPSKACRITMTKKKAKPTKKVIRRVR